MTVEEKAKKAAYQKRYQKKLLAKKLCIYCGKYPHSPTSKSCSLCKAGCARWNREYYRTNTVARERNRAQSLATKVRYNKEGRCIRCGDPMTEFDEGFKKCLACRAGTPRSKNTSHVYEELMIKLTTENYKEAKRNADNTIQNAS